LSGSLSLLVVVFEKACDMLSLLLWCVFGLILYPSKDWLFLVMTASVIFGLVGAAAPGSRSFAKLFFAIGKAHLKSAQARKVACSWVKCTIISGVTKSTTKITSTSVLIWFCTCCKSGFILSLRAWTILANLALSPLAIQQACCH